MAFYERAIRAIAEANEAEAAARGAGAGLEGRLRVCTPVPLGRLHLVPKLGAFLEAHPKIHLELVMDDRDKDLVAENIDAALRLGVLPDSALMARKLAQAQMLVVASPTYLARNDPVTFCCTSLSV
jgi:DNA-binding transcriptional LysR family regulator